MLNALVYLACVWFVVLVYLLLQFVILATIVACAALTPCFFYT